MAENQKVVLVSPDGKREWTPENPAERTNLLAAGWGEKPSAKAPKSDNK